MYRLLLLSLFSCAFFAACSSDESVPLKEWFDDQGVALSYNTRLIEKEVLIKRAVAGFDSSAFMVSSFAALGNAGDLEHSLYFGLKLSSSEIRTEWKFRMDSLFYSDFYKDGLPTEERISAQFYWLFEDSLEHDTAWVKFSKKWRDSADIVFDWQPRSSKDSFTIALPDAFIEDYGKYKDSSKQDTINALALLKLGSDLVLRVSPPLPIPLDSDIEGLVRVAQKPRLLKPCEACLFAGVSDSVTLSLDMKDARALLNETVVFAQIALPKTDASASSEIENIAIPVYARGEEYKTDTAYVNAKGGHPNLLFFQNNDSLTLQVTKGLRNYAAAAKQPDSLSFVLLFGNPMLNTESLAFISSAFAARPAYAKYDFSALAPKGESEGQKATLRIWLADYGNEKK